MNLTVGPMPPAVYWRRRALVLGVVLLLVLLTVALCHSTGHSDGTAPRSNGAGGGAPASVSATTSEDTDPPVVTYSGGDGGGGGDLPGSTDPGGGSGGVDAEPPGGGGLDPDAPACTDAQLSVTAEVQKLSSGYYLTLKVRNISTTTCNRDVGSGPQELRVVNSANAVVWSSDFCQSASHAPDLRTFGPNIEASFRVWWNGKAVQGPHCGRSSVLQPATYQVYARVGTKLSPPVPLLITGPK